jgi:MoaA/NifB/PqqE/SkfB family radical SAM enzyme
MTRIHSLFLKPTLRCNARCLHCRARREFYRTLRGEPLSAAQLAGVIRDARRLGAGALHLSGGEPTLYPGLADLVEEGKRSGMYVILNTNGSLVTERLAGDLLEAGLDAVIISIHAAEPSLHDEIKGVKGSYEGAVRAAATFRRLGGSRRGGFLMTTQTVVTRLNFRQLPRIIALASGLGSDAHGISYVEGDFDGEFLLGVEEIRELREKVLPAACAQLARHGFANPLVKVAALRLLRGFYAGDADRAGRYAAGLFACGSRGRCRTPSVFAMVLADGSVLPCNMTEYTGGPVMGNVRNMTLERITGGAAWKKFEREGYEGCRLCPTHLHFHIPLSIGLGKLLALATKNPASEQKSVLRRMAEAIA